MTEFDPRYSPHFLKCLYILIIDNLYGGLMLALALPSFIFDWILQTFFGSYLPGNIKDLLDVDTYNKCCFDTSGKKAESVRFASQKEQHANSTERAWFIVKYEGDTEETRVFAKCQARNIFVRIIMSVFNVYRNELCAYKDITFPVKIPKVYGAKWTPSRFVLVLEDLSSKNVEFPNIWSKKVDSVLAKQVLTTIAQIHAKFWKKSPNGVWNDRNRPYYGIGMGMYTLYNVEKYYKKNLVPEKIHKVFMQALWHWWEYRKYLSKSQPKTMCHGDSHMGNFYIEPNGSIGCVDFQVLSEENPMRDVTYFLSSSYDPDLLEKDEVHMIKFYLDRLVQFGVPQNEVPTFEDAWFAYRMQLFYTLYAFVFSGGFANLMDHVQTDCGVERIVRVMERVDSTGALYEMLDGRSQ